MLARPHTIGQLAQLACEWEVRARKAGNVCPGREFPDLTVSDFLKSAAAIAPIMEQARAQPLGVTILRAIEATRRVVNTNTNLGIVLLLAPLASVPLDEPLAPGLARVLAQTTVEDSRNVYAAIRLAKPAGLGKVANQDIADEPTLPLRDVMALASDRDSVAAQYVTNFGIVRDTLGFGLGQSLRNGASVERAIIEMHLYALFRCGDDLIVRKTGEQVSHFRVMIVLNSLDTANGRQAFRELDAWFRSDNHLRNPGTTADLIAAALFVALREGIISADAPFPWHEHPFKMPEPRTK